VSSVEERIANRPSGRGGRPTRSEATRRQQHLIEIAGAMFMRHGFDGTSIDAVAEAAGMSKRTVYARYRDKNELFRAVLRELIERWLVPIKQFESEPTELEPMLMQLGRHLLNSALAPQALSVHRIVIGESERWPEFGHLANSEGRGPAIAAIATVLRRHAPELRVEDFERAAEQFLSLVVDSALRSAAFGLKYSRADVEKRVRACVDLFLNGVRSG
jgi:TetR/AcrR family transcriptional regulator, mexJK operon transcriptional repressor